MESLATKVRISILWIILAVTMSAMMILWLLGPGVIEEVIAGKMEGMAIGPGILVMMALFWLIPLVMAFLSVTLKDLANRRTNLIMSGIFTVFNVLHLIGHIVQGYFPLDYAVIALFTIAVPALIFWYARKWPKPEVWFVEAQKRQEQVTSDSEQAFKVR